MSDVVSHQGRRLGEVIAVLGVILSLIFVGLQIRQTAIVASAQAVQDLAAMSQDFLLTVATDPEAQRVWTATYWGTEEVTGSEERRATYIMIAFVRRTESGFVQVERGLLPESALEAYGMSEITARFENARFRSFWSQRRGTLHPAFVTYVEQRTERQP